jgi:hypothetical protein
MLGGGRNESRPQRIAQKQNGWASTITNVEKSVVIHVPKKSSL